MDKDFDILLCEFVFGDMPSINGKPFENYYFETYDFKDACFNTYTITSTGILLTNPCVATCNHNHVHEHTGTVIFSAHDLDLNDKVRFYVYGAYFLQGELQFIQSIDCNGDFENIFNGMAHQQLTSAYEKMCLTKATQHNGMCSPLSKI